MNISVRNMVCARCIKVVKQILSEIDIPFHAVELGRIQTITDLSPDQKSELKTRLEQEGFGLAEDQNIATVEKIKNRIIDLVYNKDLSEFKTNISVYLSAALHKDYSALSQLFSSTENTTIEQYFILQKLERVKEMLVYDHLSLSEIAWKMGYSSVAHLSAQFKKITGFTPSNFKQLKEHKRKNIDAI